MTTETKQKKKTPALVACCHCNTARDPYDMETIAGEYFCAEDCIDYYTACNDCGDPVHEEDARTDPSGNTICECCAEDYFYCDCCGDMHHCDDGYNTPDYSYIYCEHCYREEYTTCWNCDREIERDQAYNVDNYDHCERCYNRLMNERLIRPYHCNDGFTERGMKDETPRHNFTRYPINIRRRDAQTVNLLPCGLELEIMPNENRDSMDREELAKKILELAPYDGFFIFNRDSSIEPGFEIITQPVTVNYHLHCVKWDAILTTIKRAGWLSHNAPRSCGLHVHTPNRALDMVQLVKLVHFIANNRADLIRFSRRTENSADNWSPYPQTFQTVRNSRGYTQLDYETRIEYLYRQTRDYLNYNGMRGAINFSRGETNEFRLFRGTLDTMSFYACIEFVDAIISFVRSASFPTIWKAGLTDLVSYAQQNSPEHKNFTQYYQTRKDAGRI